MLSEISEKSFDRCVGKSKSRVETNPTNAWPDSSQWPGTTVTSADFNVLKDHIGSVLSKADGVQTRSVPVHTLRSLPDYVSKLEMQTKQMKGQRDALEGQLRGKKAKDKRNHRGYRKRHSQANRTSSTQMTGIKSTEPPEFLSVPPLSRVKREATVIKIEDD